MNRRNDEHRIQAALFKWARYSSARYPGLGLMFAIPNGGARDAITGAMLKAEGVKPGVPDIFLPVPVNGFHGLFIEMKTLRGKPSAKQQQWLKQLASQGYATSTCHGLRTAVDTITLYMAGQFTPVAEGLPQRNPSTPKEK